MKKSSSLFLGLLLLFIVTSAHANGSPDSTKIYVNQSFAELKQMMEGKQQPDFERAVFISENPYHSNKYTYDTFQKSIDFHLFFIDKLAAANNHSDTMNFVAKVNSKGRFNIDDILVSPEKKKQLYNNVVNNWAIFAYITDTTGYGPYYHAPFDYASSDPFGLKDWSTSQVINLLASERQEGNCFALTAFYKIMADRLNTGAYICTAPQHIYIQHQDHKGDYYNVELATAGHPGDGMLQTLTYTTSTAVESGISLRSYNDRQSIGLCLINLAKAYEHKFNTKDDDFLLQCAETVLQNDSLNLNALLLKHQVLNERMLKLITVNKTTVISKFVKEKTFTDLETHLTTLNRLGYIQMPMEVQETVLNGFDPKDKTDKNPKPFTSVNVPEDENTYTTLTDGLFQEIFEPHKFEEYGQFTFDTESKTIAAIDTTKKNFALIDPVAFAYDFGARIYDSRLGKMLSIDPKTNKYPGLSPYQFSANMPITLVDNEGEDFRYKIEPNTNGGGTITVATTIHLYGAQANQELVDKLNSDWTALGTSGTYFDSNGNEWKVLVNATYVLNKSLDAQANASGQNNPSTGKYPSLDAFSESSILPGDNVMQVDETASFEKKSVGGETKANTSLVRGAGAGKHETGHFFGFNERYDEKFPQLIQTNFINDIMGNGTMDNAHPLHMINMGANIIEKALLPDGSLWDSAKFEEQYEGWNVVRNPSVDEGRGTLTEKNSENTRRMQEQEGRKK